MRTYATPAKAAPATGASFLVQRRSVETPGHTSEASETEKAGIGLQAKLIVGGTDDPAEREADAAARDVMAAGAPRLTAGPVAQVSRRAEAGAGGGQAAPASVAQAIHSPGEPLGVAERAFFEPRFGHDFGAVRIHRDGAAAASAQDVAARAYAVGNHLVFGADSYAPASPSGRSLIAHELAHVIQQTANGQTGRVQRQSAARTDNLEKQVNKVLKDPNWPEEISTPLFDPVLKRAVLEAYWRTTMASSEAPFPISATSSMDDSAPEYDGPAISELHEPHDRRRRTLYLYTDDPMQRTTMEVWATPEELSKMQNEITLQEARSRSHDLLAAVVGGAHSRASLAQSRLYATRAANRGQGAKAAIADVRPGPASNSAGRTPTVPGQPLPSAGNKPTPSSPKAPPKASSSAQPKQQPSPQSTPKALPMGPPVPKQLLPGGVTTLTKEQVQNLKGTNVQRGTAGKNHQAELSGGNSREKVTNTTLGPRLHDIRDERVADTTVFRREVKNYKLWLTDATGKKIRNEVKLSKEIYNQIQKDELFILEGQKIGEHRVVQWDFVGAPPNAELQEFLQKSGIPHSFTPSE